MTTSPHIPAGRGTFLGAPAHIIRPIPGEDLTEMAVRAWEAELHVNGWDQAPGLAFMMSMGGDGFCVAQLDVPDNVINPPHELLRQLAGLDPAKLRQVLVDPEWALNGLHIIGMALAVEVWAVYARPDEHPDIKLAGYPNLTEHPDRIEQRRVLLVGAEPGDVHTLVRFRDHLGLYYHQGNAPEFTGATFQNIGDGGSVLARRMHVIVNKLVG